MARRENEYQAKLIIKIKRLIPGTFILKNDSSYIQGIPDLTVLYRDRWAVLEVKRSAFEEYQPNQQWYLDQFNEMSFSATIFPENEEEVLRDLQYALGSRRKPRVSQR